MQQPTWPQVAHRWRATQCGHDPFDFGLTWNQVLEAGGLLVGDAVRLAVDISAVKAASAQAA